MKAWYASKTIWFNVVLSVLGVAAALQGSFPEWGIWLGAVTTIGNVILRIWFTDKPIGTEV